MVGPAGGEARAGRVTTHSLASSTGEYTPAVSMVEHASSRAPLNVGRPVLLLLLICAVWVVSVPARPSLRPSSPEEFRKLLLWAQKAAEHGDIQPPFPSAEQLNEVDKVWSRTHKKGYLQDVDLIGHPQRPYVESSDFRRRRPATTTEASPPIRQTSHSRPQFLPSKEVPPATESVPVIENQPSEPTIPVEKTIFPKKVDHTRSKPISETLAYYIDDNPDAEKKLESLSHASIFYINDSVDKESLPDPFRYAGTKTSADASSVKKEVVVDSQAEASSVSSPVKSVVEDTVVPSGIPPVFGQSLLSGELTGASVSRLPSYEEYDRSQRYSHSFLHGFTGF
ncbi:uncharacterized protein [Anabrus simplex]|uniref:uncharacterized protein n=1 Tax=Anabrus simplex TaxID=316456 RepID=UPI0035A2B5E9